MKSVYLNSLAVLLTIALFAGCGSSERADSIRPEITVTVPADAATDVPVNFKAAAAFSEALDPATINATTFTVTGPSGIPTAGTVTYDAKNSIATFTPAENIATDATYTAIISTGIKDLAGNSPDSSYQWSFRTGSNRDVAPPTVIFTIPSEGETGVTVNKTITATFSEAMDPLTINLTTFTVATGSTPATGSVAYDPTTNIASFTPAGNLASSPTFTVTITTGVKDLAGNPMAANKVWSFTTAAGQSPVILNSAGTFAVLAGTAVTSLGVTQITGNVGVSPNSSVTGLPPAQVNGTIHAADPVAAQAKLDLTSAFIDAQGRSVNSQALSADIGGLTFTPGLYTRSTSVLVSGDVTLDGLGDGNSVFIFQVGSALATDAGVQILLTGGARASNVFWQIGTSAALAPATAFKGNILAQTSITMGNSSTLDGRALAENGAVTLDNNTISVPAP